MNENEYIIACKEGKLEQFSPLYENYADRIYKYLHFRVRHRETAEDICSAVFLKAIENIGQYQPERGSFSSWLYRIAHNALIDHYRKQGKGDIAVGDELPDTPDETDIEREIQSKHDSERLRRHMQQLTAEQQQIITLRVWDDRPFREIAEIVGKTEANAKMMFYRSVKKLSEVMMAIVGMLPTLSNFIKL